MDQFERLEDIFKNNNNKGMAVAITGQWGIGKTFFWNKFINERAKREEERKYLPSSITKKYPNFFNKKYAYISLFGVESLADLKTAICTDLSSNHFYEFSSKKIETPILLKKFISQFRDIKVSQYGVSASARLIESLLFAQVSNAIICFDDFERMSNKLDIKDVMGLANQLKWERNCQVILILDESRTNDKNNYYEYKEKLINEEIKINSVEPLIRENSKDFDTELVELMINFADKLEIHNFRFFQKVIKLYKKFKSELPDEIAYSAQEIILIRILQGYLINDYPLLEHDWDDLKNDEIVMRSNQPICVIKKQTLEKLDKISDNFLNLDQWAIEYRKWFDQKDKQDIEILKQLANSELISKKQYIYKVRLDNLITKLKNLQVDSNFCKELYSCVVCRIYNENLNMFWEYYLILDQFGEHKLSEKLKKEVKTVIDNSPSRYWEEISVWGIDDKNIFHRYLRMRNFLNPIIDLPSLGEVLECHILEKNRRRGSEFVLKNSTFDDWHLFIWETVPNNPKLRNLSLLTILKCILEIEESEPKIREYIDQILKEKSNESELMKSNIEILNRLMER